MDWARTRSPAASRRPRRSACLLCCCCYYYYYYCYSYLHSPPCFLGCGHREGCYDYPGVSEQEEQSATSGQRDATCKHEQNANFLPPFGEIAISAPFSAKGRADSGKGKMNRKVPDKDQRKRKKNAKRNGDQKERTGRKLAASLYGRNLSFSTCTAHTLFLLFFLLPLAKIDWPRERGLSRGTNASRKRSDHNKSQSKTEENVVGQRPAACLGNLSAREKLPKRVSAVKRAVI